MRIVIDLQGAQAVGSRDRGIGRYSRGLTRGMIQNRGEHEVIVALNGGFPETIDAIRSDFADVLDSECFKVWNPIGPVHFADPGNDQRRLVAEAQREHFLASLNPDFIHIPSLFEGFGDDAVCSIGTLHRHIPTSVTLHDLIPLIHRKIYLANPRFEQWYENRLGHLRRADLLLSNSESSRREAIEQLDFPGAAAICVGGAADSQCKKPALSASTSRAIRSRYGIDRPFVLYTGGIDVRKNIEALVRAFCMLQKDIRNAHQLAIVCAIQDQDKRRLLELATSGGLRPRDIVTTGFVPEEDLVALYSLCELFVFPSWHEGFGLPALEAMWCDAPVIASNRSSLPEVVGLEEALFDPMDDQSISDAIHRGLTDQRFRKKLVANAKKQRVKFSWDDSGQRAIAEMEKLRHERRVSSPRVGARRPKLAFVSPVPPAKTGIADYSAELLPELSRHYDVDVVLKADHPQSADPFIAGALTVISEDAFRAHHRAYDRILYHFGNSDNHEHMFDLLARTGGVVVLHDFFLSGIVAHREWHGGQAGLWSRELYESHGYPAVLFRKNARPESEAVWKYPCNGSVLAKATGIIAHSENSARLARDWYGAKAAENVDVIPLLRVPPSENFDRNQKRTSLGFAETDFVVCSFGMIGSTKLNHRLVEAWHAAGFGKRPECKLVFVGQNDPGRYGEELVSRIEQLGLNDSVTITGWADAEQFRTYLMSADAAVQLRTLSRGETSAAVLDALNYGIPLIVNANGAMTDLPGDIVTILADEFETQDLGKALERLRADPARRAVIASHSQSYVREHHSPRHCADLYRDSIEGFYAKSDVTNSLIERVRSLNVDNAFAADLAEQIDRETAPSQARLFVDISQLAMADARTGIQRVVRSIVRELVSEDSLLRVEPVYFCENSHRYRFARSFMSVFLGVSLGGAADEIADIKTGDILLCLDLNPRTVHDSSEYLAKLRRSGIRVVFVVYDLLPINLPECFPPEAEDNHQKWLDVVLQADEAICISEAVADELREYAAKRAPDSRLKISSFPLGSDFEQHPDGRGLEVQQVEDRFAGRQTFVMVGTIEPRKGHALVIDAFERLWSQGADVNLCIVGKQGWIVESLIDRMRTLAARQPRFSWLSEVSDGTLQALYQEATCLIAASLDEGFGLPIVEAAKHGLPIIARDIPVFREVGRDGTAYFSATTGEALASFITAWLKKFKRGETPNPAQVRQVTWRQSAIALLGRLNGSSEVDDSASVAQIRTAELLSA